MAGALAGSVDLVGDDAGLSEPHADSATTADAAQAASPTVEYMREKFTVVTLQLGWSPIPEGRRSE
jgi:hypothetical protein